MEGAPTSFACGNEGRDGQGELVKYIGEDHGKSAHELFSDDFDVVGIFGGSTTGGMLEVHSLWEDKMLTPLPISLGI